MAESSDRGAITAREMGQRGGRANLEKYGVEHMRNLGRLGGARTAERHGPEFYEEIGRKGGARVRELIARGKAAQEDEPCAG